MNADNLRPEVLAFALMMEGRLCEKDESKHQTWKAKSEADLMVHASSKTFLLEAAVRCEFFERIRHAVDLANFCMMIADVAGALEPKGGYAVYSRPECPFTYCDTAAPHCEPRGRCRHAEPDDLPTAQPGTTRGETA
ncbi:MAG: hypothetical protein WB870_09545 [Gallionellaceae bacterium]